MNLLQQVEKKQVRKLIDGKSVPSFRAGDTVKVHVKVIEGNRERTQLFEGVVLGLKKRGVNSSFRVRKISNGEGVERVFSLYSPNINVEVTRHGQVRRAKLYYLRDLTGKKARIAEKSRGDLDAQMISPEELAAIEAEKEQAAAEAAAEAEKEAKAQAAKEAEAKQAEEVKTAPAEEAPVAKEASTEEPKAEEAK